jgi:hypothetical protein
MMKKLFQLLAVVYLLIPSQGMAQNPKWDVVAPGVWKTIVGDPEKYDLLKAAGVQPNLEALARLGNAGFPLATNEIVAEVSDAKTSLRFPLVKEEQLYGFGLNFKTVQQRGKIMQLHVDHYGGTDNGRTHAPVPFYISDQGYGVFVNSARYITVYAGTAVRKDSPNAPEPRDRNTDKNWTASPYSDGVEMLIPAKGVEIYLFAGSSMLDVCLPAGGWDLLSASGHFSKLKK